MKLKSSFLVLAAVLAAAMFPPLSLGQSSLPRFGAGVKASTLGIGIEGATAVTGRSNVRFGVNTFGYNKSVRKDGVDYGAKLSLSSLQLNYDQYVVGGFHVSPGLLFHNRNRINATASVPAGGAFSLGGTQYYSNQSIPVRGTANVKLGKTAPMVLLGFGNLLPRNGRHFGVNFETGVVFQGSPDATLNLTGTACVISPTAGCANASTDPMVQANVRSEQNKLNNDLRPLRYYPVVSLGFSWQFLRPAQGRR